MFGCSRLAGSEVSLIRSFLQEVIAYGHEAGCQQLDRHALGERAVVAFGQINSAGAASAEQREEPVRPDRPPGQIVRLGRPREVGQELAWAIVRLEQGGDLGGEPRLADPEHGQERLALCGRALDRLLEEVRDSCPSDRCQRIMVPVHRRGSSPLVPFTPGEANEALGQNATSAADRGHISSSRRSQARATLQSRLTVLAETPSTAAASSTVRPPKYRNSTTLA